MRCAEFNQLLPDLLRGSLPQALRDACDAHLLECAICLECLADASAGQWQHQDVTAMLDSIVQSTIPDLCATSAYLLCDSLDGTLSTEQSLLLSSHLDSCKACQSLQASLLTVSAQLPQMAQRQPPAALLARILLSTTHQLPVAAGFLQRVHKQLEAVLLRPRFALEAAFSVTLVWTLLFGVPASILDTAFAEQPALVQRLELPQIWTRAQAGLEFEIVELGSGVARPVKALEKQLTAGINTMQGTGRESWRSLLSWIDAMIAGFSSGYSND